MAGKKAGGGWLLFWLAFFIGVTLLFMLNLESIKGTLRGTQVLDRLSIGSPGGDEPEQAGDLNERIQQLTGTGKTASNSSTEDPGAGSGVTSDGTNAGAGEGSGQVTPNQTKTVERLVYLMKVDNTGTILWTKVKRDLPASDRPLQDVMESLMRGPSTEEEKQGFISLIPKNVKILNAVVRGSTAYVSFSEDFLFNTYGVEGYAGQRRQIILTATEFNNVKDVQILIDGKRIDYLGEGIWIGSPVSRNML
ncbi:hypothetical protein AGMMS50230_03720 [Spirochaetia bacterium]|nr:hypothetical protein AGMMS50230_03720 [Spirochaetia bacterium]